MELPVETAVFNRGRGLGRNGGDQGCVFRTQRLATGAAAERQHRDRRVFGHARNEVIEALIAPELDLFGSEACGRQRIVKTNRVSTLQSRADARYRRQPWRRDA